MAQKGPVVPPARASCRDPIERVNLLRAPATLVTLLIAVQGLTPTPSSATSELPRQYNLIRVIALLPAVFEIWLSDVPHGLWCRLLRQLLGLLPLEECGAYTGHR